MFVTPPTGSTKTVWQLHHSDGSILLGETKALSKSPTPWRLIGLANPLKRSNTFYIDETITVLADTSNKICSDQYGSTIYYCLYIYILLITTAKYIIYNPRNKDVHFIPENLHSKIASSSSRGFQDAPSLVALQQTAPSLRTALQAGLLEAKFGHVNVGRKGDG